MTKKSKRSKTFAVCIDNAGYLASLQAGKLYKVVPDQKAQEHGLLRVVDESGEDYGYSAKRFFILGVPQALERVLSDMAAARQPSLAMRPRAMPPANATMKNQARRKPLASKDNMRPEDDFKKRIRGKHAAQYADGTNAVVLERDVVRRNK